MSVGGMPRALPVAFGVRAPRLHRKKKTAFDQSDSTDPFD